GAEGARRVERGAEARTELLHPAALVLLAEREAELAGPALHLVREEPAEVEGGGLEVEAEAEDAAGAERGLRGHAAGVVDRRCCDAEGEELLGQEGGELLRRDPEAPRWELHRGDPGTG